MLTEGKEMDVRAEWRRLTKLLIERGLTITTMESATAGQLASLITDTEGSSAVLKGAFVTYCNEAKIRMGVPAEVIEKYTVYSEETARAMAEACRSAYAADIGIGVTGTMGNVDPANPDASEPGQVYFALSLSPAAAGNAAGSLSPAAAGNATGSLSPAAAGNAAGGAEPVLKSFHLSIEPQPTRLAYKLAVAGEIVKELFRVLEAEPV